MSRVVYIDRARVALAPGALVGQGGEAEVYDLGDGRVVKWWKPASHPDFEGLPAAQAAATRRIAEAPARLDALPRGLPAAVVAPGARAFADRRSTQLVGYVMPKIVGTPLHAYGEPRWRRDHAIAGTDVVAMLLGLHAALDGLHRAGVVMGDCNDLNVLVDGTRVHLIDVDSYQLPGLPCAMFSERFVDPRLCDAAGCPRLPHDATSDWFAFAVMAFRSLLHVSPWGGVHQPAAAAQRCPAAARAHRRITVYAPDVIYPRAARPLATLPAELTATFRAIFEQGASGELLRPVLERLRLHACPGCGEEHGCTRCPACQARMHGPAVVVHGRLQWQAIPRDTLTLATQPVTSDAAQSVWLVGPTLYRRGRLGPERIGDVLPAQTRAWFGASFGIGFYRAGGYTVGFTFRPDRGGLDDRLVLPRMRGQLVDAACVLGADHAWLALTTADRGRLVTTLVVVDRTSQVLATCELTDAAWLPGFAGACAAGPHLFVPTDAGIARVEIVQGSIVQTRTFPETAPLVGAADRLALFPGAIAVDRRHDAIRLQLT